MHVKVPEHAALTPACRPSGFSLVLGLVLALAGCSRDEGRSGGDGAAAEAAARVVTAPPDSAVARTAVRLVVAPSGNEARYRVREQLVRVDLPNDAVGETGKVSGGLSFDSAGRVIASASRFVIDAATLESDRERRDGYVRNRTLDTETYPTIVLRPTEVRGLAWPLPAAGTDSFEISGELTIKGVTRPTTWRAAARFEDGAAGGSAATAFTFDDFGLAQPRVPVVLSVADTIRLEYDFRLVPAQTSVAAE
jgi:polyisoprenoid-binding protein YceI